MSIHKTHEKTSSIKTVLTYNEKTSIVWLSGGRLFVP